MKQGCLGIRKEQGRKEGGSGEKRGMGEEAVEQWIRIYFTVQCLLKATLPTVSVSFVPHAV